MAESTALTRSNMFADVFTAGAAGVSYSARQFEARTEIYREGDPVDYICLLTEGWAARSKMMLDGSRLISALYIPGDVVNLDAFIHPRSRSTLIALTGCTLAAASMESVRRLADGDGEVRRRLWTLISRENAVLSERLVSLGRRTTRQRLAHLLCELQARLEGAGLTSDGSIHLPLTQQDLGDTLGVSTVHINRTLQAFRSEGVIVFKKGRLVLADLAALRELGDFNQEYVAGP